MTGKPKARQRRRPVIDAARMFFGKRIGRGPTDTPYIALLSW